MDPLHEMNGGAVVATYALGINVKNNTGSPTCSTLAQTLVACRHLDGAAPGKTAHAPELDVGVRICVTAVIGGIKKIGIRAVNAGYK